jgi:hypothetical protein
VLFTIVLRTYFWALRPCKNVGVRPLSTLVNHCLQLPSISVYIFSLLLYLLVTPCSADRTTIDFISKLTQSWLDLHGEVYVMSLHRFFKTRREPELQYKISRWRQGNFSSVRLPTQAMDAPTEMFQTKKRQRVYKHMKNERVADWGWMGT